MVLAGDFKQHDGRLGFSNVGTNWGYLKDKGAITIVFRLNTNLNSLLQKSDFKNIAADFIQSAEISIDVAKQNGVGIDGIQLDYDCPTAKLQDFVRFVKIIKEEWPLVQVSITALPTWINNNAFQDLITCVDYYVLQLHSFEIPQGQNKKGYIFPALKAPGYFDSGLKLKKPFYISLPTYGYEVAYSKENKFLGLRAESGAEFIGEDIKRKLMFADPKEIADFLRYVSKKCAENFKGVAWFRLPIDSDRYNWDIKTLKRVMMGELPQTYLTVDIVDAGAQVKEIYLLNVGEVNITREVSFDLNWVSDEKPIYDVLGDFAYSDIANGVHIKGKAPMVGNKMLAAWFRGGDSKEFKISKSEVTIDEED